MTEEKLKMEKFISFMVTFLGFCLIAFTKTGKTPQAFIILGILMVIFVTFVLLQGINQ